MTFTVSLIGALKIIMLVSIFFVWVVRYENIVEEFEQYNYPSWVRDLVGILKISFALMLFSPDTNMVLMGSGGIIGLMLAAFVTHVRIKNPVNKMLPSLSIIALSSIVFLNSM